MHDEAFLFAFEKCSLSKDFFNHRGHVRIAWLYLTKYVFDHALIRTTQGIFCLARSLGVKHIYHETLTRAWVHLIHNEIHSPAKSFDDFIAQKPNLLHKSLPLQYYSPARLESELARKEWVLPDIKPFYD